MNNLRKYLNENRDLLDDREPPEGHFRRFENRLDKFQSSGKKTKYLRFSAIAASVAILISLSWFMKNDTKDTNDIYVTQQYYQEKMSEKLALIECKLEKADWETRSQLETDLEILQQDNEDFLQIIQDNKDSEIMLEYLEQHYQTNLRVLSIINNKLGNHIKC